MQIDKITFNDISIFHPDEEFSIFHRLNFTKTVGGKEWLRRFFMEPHHDLKRIIGVQNIIKTLLNHIDDWPKEITNGTVIMMMAGCTKLSNCAASTRNTIASAKKNVRYICWPARMYSPDSPSHITVASGSSRAAVSVNHSIASPIV